MFWKKIRSGMMFVVAFVTCPCHLLLTLPLALVLLAGTPAAVWITQNVGWVYGVMTILFLLSLSLGLSWMGRTNIAECEPRPVRSIETIPKGARNE